MEKEKKFIIEFQRIIKQLKTHPHFGEKMYFLSYNNIELFAYGFFKSGQIYEKDLLIKLLKLSELTDGK